VSDETDVVERVMTIFGYAVGFIVIVAGISIYFSFNWLFVAFALLFVFISGQYVVDTIAKAITDAAKILRGDKGSED
jgi:hypothetical protein